MRLLVTGAGGFLGGHVAREARALGHRVVGVTRPGRNLPEGLVDEQVEADLADVASMRRVGRETRVDVALHAAWSVGPQYRDRVENLDCVGGTLALLRGLDEGGCRRIVALGSHLEYAPSADLLDESSPIGPTDLYGACKHATHVAGAAFAGARGRALAWARVFNVVGPGEPGWQLLPQWASALVRGDAITVDDARAVRGLLHVDDAARALLALADSDRTGAFDVGHPDGVRIEAVARALAARAGRPDAVVVRREGGRTDGRSRAVTAARRLTRELGWTPAIGLARGLADAVVAAEAAPREASPDGSSAMHPTRPSADEETSP